MSLVTPYTAVAATVPTAANLNTWHDSILQLQGGSPTAGPLDFAQLRQTATQTLTTATFAAITFDVEDTDYANGHSTSTNTSRYTVAVAGQIQVEAGVAFAGNATGLRSMRIMRNGAAFAAGRISVSPAPAANYTEIALTRTISCAVGDYITIEARQDSGGNLATAYTANEVGCFLNVRWVHS